MVIKRSNIFFLLLIVVSMWQFVSAVTLGNQTVYFEGVVSNSTIKIEQDTIVDSVVIDSGFAGIKFDNLRTFNSTFNNINVTYPAKLLFTNLVNSTVHFSNGSSFDVLGANNNINLSVAASENVTLSSIVDIIKPFITIHEPQPIQYNLSFVDLDVSANEPINTWKYSLDNGTTNTSFVPNTSITGLTNNFYYLTVFGTDFGDNINSSIVVFSIVLVPSQIVNSSVCRYRKFGYWNNELPFMKEANCL